MSDHDPSRSARPGMWRSRWAAVGAAVAVTLGGGGYFAVYATSAPSAFVAITPVRVLDTRLATFAPALASKTPRALKVTGTIPTVAADGTTVGNAQVVPAGATAIVANVTAVGPSTAGFVAVRPGTATGTPATSNLNFTTGGGVTPNSVTVEIPTSGASSGRIQLWFSGTAPSATTHLLVDIVGYYTTSGSSGPDPARIVWVAKSGGDFTSVRAAVASITDATSDKPYLVKVAPGFYDEAGGVTMKDGVDLEGSGVDATTIRCACSSATVGGPGVAAVRFTGDITAELRDLTVTNTGGGPEVKGVLFENTGGAARIVDAVVEALAGTSNTHGITVSGSTARVERTRVSVTGTAGFNEGVYVEGAGAPVLDELDVTTIAPGSPRALTLIGVSPIVVTDSVVRATATVPGSGSPITVHVAGPARLERTDITATGGAVARGVWVFGGSAEVDDSVVLASGATTNYGVDANFGGAEAFIADSKITGSTFSVRKTDAGQTVQIATSQLSGPTTGTPTCFNTYGSTFAAFACA